MTGELGKRLALGAVGILLAVIGLVVQDYFSSMIDASKENTEAIQELTVELVRVQSQAAFETDAMAAQIRIHLAENH